jgi:hypothetical protein
MATKRLCTVEGCDKPVEAWGWCSGHYSRWQKHGDVVAERPLRRRAPSGEPMRFIREVALRHASDECLYWPYTVAGGGYGALRIGGRNRKRGSHVMVCVLAHGPAPSANLEVAHSCNHRLCCNPRHLRWATRTENHADKVEHGTSVRGERNGSARLTEAEVRQIKALQGTMSQNKIANQFKVCASTIRNIREGKTWGWVMGARC